MLLWAVLLTLAVCVLEVCSSPPTQSQSVANHVGRKAEGGIYSVQSHSILQDLTEVKKSTAARCGLSFLRLRGGKTGGTTDDDDFDPSVDVQNNTTDDDSEWQEPAADKKKPTKKAPAKPARKGKPAAPKSNAKGSTTGNKGVAKSAASAKSKTAKATVVKEKPKVLSRMTRKEQKVEIANRQIVKDSLAATDNYAYQRTRFTLPSLPSSDMLTKEGSQYSPVQMKGVVKSGVKTDAKVQGKAGVRVSGLVPGANSTHVDPKKKAKDKQDKDVVRVHGMQRAGWEAESLHPYQKPLENKVLDPSLQGPGVQVTAQDEGTAVDTPGFPSEAIPAAHPEEMPEMLTEEA